MTPKQIKSKIKTDFLRQVTSTRESKSNLDIQPTVDENKTDTEEGESDLNTDRTTSGEQSYPSQKRVLHAPITKPPPAKRTQAKEKRSCVQGALEEFNDIVSKVNKQDAFDVFGQYVAIELRELPSREAIILQQQIQNLITNTKLSNLPSSSCMPSCSPSTYAQSVVCSIPQPSPDPDSVITENYTSTTNTKKSTDYANVLPNTVWNKKSSDVLEEAMQNSFLDSTDNAIYIESTQKSTSMFGCVSCSSFLLVFVSW
nr:uncharacterized protein LOC111413889 [Onthophagus taurus]